MKIVYEFMFDRPKRVGTKLSRLANWTGRARVIWFERRRNDDSRTLLRKVSWTCIFIFTVLNALPNNWNTFSDEFDLELNDSFEDSNLFTFGEDTRTLEDVAPISNRVRFTTVSCQGIQDIITNSKAKSTRKNTNWAMNTFRGRPRSSKHLELPG